MLLLKFRLVLIMVLTVNTAVAQNKQQKVLEKILTDQKRWQQSKMPTRTIYKNNFSYQVPMFPGERMYSGNGLSVYENKQYRRLFTVKYPTSYTHKSDTISLGNKSYVRFSKPNIIPKAR